MRTINARLRGVLPAAGAALLALACFVGAYCASGNGIARAQATGGPGGGGGGPSPMLAPLPPPGTGGAGGPSGVPGMPGGMGGPMGMMAGGRSQAPAGPDLFGPLTTPGTPAAPPAQDYATSASAFVEDPQWAELDERYEVSMEWARQIDAKWQPIRKAELHYHLAALGLAISRPQSDWDVLHPRQIDLEGRRMRERYIDAYVAAQRDFIPPKVMENLRESARLAVERKTRLSSGKPKAGSAETGAESAPPPSPEDLAAFEKRWAEELEYLIYVYIAGYDAAPWCRTAYDPADRTFDDQGRPKFGKLAPPYYHPETDSQARASTGASVGAGRSGGAGSGAGMMGSAGAAPGARGAVGSGGGAGGGGGPGKSLPAAGGPGGGPSRAAGPH